MIRPSHPQDHPGETLHDDDGLVGGVHLDGHQCKSRICKTESTEQLFTEMLHDSWQTPNIWMGRRRGPQFI
jgi:hypothetical protein